MFTNIQACYLRIILIILLVAIIEIVPSYSQSISSSNLLWTADQVTDFKINNTMDFQCQFKTNGIEQVTWIQKKGQMTTNYNVTRTEGSWEDISVSGTFTYFLERNGKDFKMTLEKKSSGTFVTLDFSKAGEYTSIQQFRIKSVQPN